MAETFGKTGKGGTQTFWTPNQIRLAKATSGSAGTLQSITLYVKQYPGKTPNVKCAIYEPDSDFNLLDNGVTEEKQVEDAQDGEMVFNFITPPSVAASTEYRLAFWNNDTFYGYNDIGDADQLECKNVTYNSFPALLEGLSHLSSDVTIYATYEEAPPAAKTLVQAALISIPPLIVLPTLREVIRFVGGC